jgi:SAM-dependent methyltransferase
MPNLQVPQSGVNAFQKPIPPLSELLVDSAIEQFVREGLTSIFSNIGLEDSVRNEVVETCIEKTLHCSSLLSYEKEVHTYLQSKGVFKALPNKTAGRANRMVEVVKVFLRPGSILDLGCGPGGVGKICSDLGYAVTLADVYQSPAIAALALPFVQLKQNAPLPFHNESFDNVLVFAMLHHVEDPLLMMSEVKRILRSNGRLHLIETVYGIQQEELSHNVNEIDQRFASLTEEQQRRATMFFDYFGNHVTWYYTEDPEKYVPVPFNFNSPSFWNETFTKNGFTAIQSRPWQIDPASGVFHYLFTFEMNT